MWFLGCFGIQNQLLGPGMWAELCPASSPQPMSGWDRSVGWTVTPCPAAGLRATGAGAQSRLARVPGQWAACGRGRRRSERARGAGSSPDLRGLRRRSPRLLRGTRLADPGGPSMAVEEEGAPGLPEREDQDW